MSGVELGFSGTPTREQLLGFETVCKDAIRKQDRRRSLCEFAGVLLVLLLLSLLIMSSPGWVMWLASMFLFVVQRLVLLTYREETFWRFEQQRLLEQRRALGFPTDGERLVEALKTSRPWEKP